MSKKVEFSIIPEKIPPSRKAKTSLYTDIVKGVLERGKGSYRIDVPDKKPKTLYQGLVKKIKGDKRLKISMRGNDVYLTVKE